MSAFTEESIALSDYRAKVKVINWNWKWQVALRDKMQVWRTIMQYVK